MEHGLGELAQRDLPLGNQDERLETGPGRIRAAEAEVLPVEALR
jgi:hypothetical protein